MPSNRFEDKLRQKFEGAKIPPSPEVWPQLEQKLDDERRKDRFLGIFPLNGWGLTKVAPHIIGVAAAGVALLFAFWLSQPEADSLNPNASQELTEVSPGTTPTSVTLEPALEHDDIQPQMAPAPYSRPANPIVSGITTKVASTSLPKQVETKSDLEVKTLENLPKKPLFASKHRLFVKNPTETLARSETKMEWNAHLGKIDLQPLDITASLDRLTEKIARPISQPAAIPASSNIVDYQQPLFSYVPLPFEGEKKKKFSFGFKGRQNRQANDLSVSLTQQGLVNNGANYPSSSFATGGGNSGTGSPVGSMDASGGTVGVISYPIVSSGAGLQMEYFINPNLSAETGIGFNRHIQGTGSFADNNDALAVQSTRNSLPDKNNGAIRFTDITVPALLNYYLRKGKSAIMVSGGLAYQRVINRQGEVSLVNPDGLPAVESINTNLNNNLLTDNNWNLMGRMHYHYNISKKFAIHGGPNIGLGLNPTYESSFIDPLRSLAVGWEVGVKFFPGS